jgi:hypothetical protein
MKKQSIHLAFFIFCKLEYDFKNEHVHARNKEMTYSRQLEGDESIASSVTETIQNCLFYGSISNIMPQA